MAKAPILLSCCHWAYNLKLCMCLQYIEIVTWPLGYYSVKHSLSPTLAEMVKISFMDCAFTGLLRQTGIKTLNNKGGNLMVAHSVPPSVEVMVLHLMPYMCIYINLVKGKVLFILSLLSLPVSVLLSLCSSGCLIWMEMGSWACQRWRGNVQSHLPPFAV